MMVNLGALPRQTLMVSMLEVRASGVTVLQIVRLIVVTAMLNRLFMSMYKDPTLCPTPSCLRFLGLIMETCH